MLLALVFAFTVMIATMPAFGAGGDISWQRVDGVSGKQEPAASMVDRSGDIVMTGFRNLAGGTDDDYWTVKFKGDGSGLAWPAVHYDKSGGSDKATAVAVDAGNNIIVTGSVWNGLNNDIHTVKYNGASGAVLWQHTYNGVVGGIDDGTAVAVDSLDNIYVAGYSQNAAGNDDFILIKYKATGPSTEGNPEWVRTLGGAGNGLDRIYGLAVAGGKVAVTGESWNGSATDILTVMYDTNGTKLWEKRYSAGAGLSCSGKYVAIDASGNVIVAGRAANAVDFDIYTVKYTGATGEPFWSKTYNGGFNDEPNALTLDQDGNVYLTGYTMTLTSNNDIFTIRYNGADGAVPTGWPNIFNSSNGNDDIATAIVLDPMGDLFITGYTITSGNYDFQTIKYTKDFGTELWHTPFNGSDNKNDRPVGIGLSATGKVLVAGWTDTTVNGLDYAVVAFDPGLLNAPSKLKADATSTTCLQLNWQDNATNEDAFVVERCQGLGCTDFSQLKDGEGVPITIPPLPGTGSVTYNNCGLSASTYYTYRVKAVNAADGSSRYSDPAVGLTVIASAIPTAWSYTYAGLAGGDDDAVAIAVGSDNNPVAVGSSIDYPPGYTEGITSHDYLTVKLNRDTKAVIWSDRFNDSTDSADVATCVAVDGNNSIIVSGYATLFNGHSDDVNSLYTQRYPAGGPPATWHDQYNGPVQTGAIDDRSVGISSAVDGSNNLAVVGYGKNAAGNDDIYVLKYSSTGTRLWAATPFNGVGNDYPRAVAFAPDGSIYVTGFSEKTLGSAVYNLFTAKYNGATGALIWSDLYSVQPNGNNKGFGLAVDPAGDVYVTGSATTASGNRDIYTIKYSGSGATPQRLWEHSVNGAGNGDDEAVSVSIDPIDFAIVVAGTTVSATSDHDITVVRYNAAGDTIAQSTHIRPTHDDTAKALALDYNGNIYIAGTTQDGAYPDSLTLKLDYLGNALGITTYNGAANNEDAAMAVAVSSLDEAFAAGYTTTASGDADQLVYKIAPDLTVPSAPYPFTLSQNYTTITLTWANKAGVKDGYHLQRKVGVCADASGWTDLADQLATATTYTSSGLNKGTIYCYRIQTFYNNGATTLTSRWIEREIATQVPQSPGNPVATVNNTTQITLTWSDNTAVESGFKIERCTGTNCDFSTKDTFTAGLNATSFVDAGVCPNTPYKYRLFSYGPDWDTPYSVETTQVTTQTPAVPANLSATRASEVQISLSWTDTTSDESGFKVYRCTGTPDSCGAMTDINNPGPYVQVGGNLAANTTTYQNTGLTPDTTYTYQVVAFKNVTCGWSVINTSPASATTNTLPPGNFSCVANNTTQVTCTWSDTSATTTSYKLERCRDGVDCPPVGTLATISPRTTTSYVDSSVCNGVTYRYRLRAVIPAAPSGYSLYTNDVLVPVPAAAAPGGLTATRASEAQINLSWTDTTSDETGFKVFRCTGTPETCGTLTDVSNPAPYAQVGGTLAANTTTFQDTGLTHNTTYTYQVVAYKTATCSWNTINATPASARTDLLAPSNPGSTFSLGGFTCYDLRVTGSDGTTLLDHWVESGCGTAATKLWVKVPSLSAGANQLYLYYGNTSAASTANGAGVFDFFDDFNGSGIDGSKWNTGGISGFSVANGLLTGNNSDYRLTSIAAFTPGVIQEAKASIQYFPPYRILMGGFFSSGSSFAGIDGDQSNTYAATNCTSTSKGGALPLNSNLLYATTLKDASTVAMKIDNLDSGALFWSPADLNCAVSSAPIALGAPTSGFTGYGYSATWDWVRVRKYASTPPSLAGSILEPGSYSLTGGSWSTRRPLTLTNGGSVLSNYQVPITIDTEALGSDRVRVNWSDTTATETGFLIERCTGAGCTFASGPATFNVGANAASFVDTTVAPNSTYCYHVIAQKSGGWSSNPSSPSCVDTSTWAMPGNFTASTTETQVNLSWSDNSVGESYFVIERCSGDQCDFSTKDTIYVAPNLTSHSDSGLCGGTFRYRIKAERAGIWTTDFTEAITASTLIPDPPGDLTAAGVNDGQIDLAWTDQTAEETGFKIERCQGSGCTNFAQIALMGANATGYQDTDTALIGNQVYRYQIRAYKTGSCAWETGYSTPAQGTATALAPTNLTATTVTGSASKINLAWTDNSVRESGFAVERCEGTGCSNFVDIAPSAGANAISYANVGLKQNTTYRYRANAYNNQVTPAWSSGYSNEAQATTGILKLSVLALTTTSVKLNWASVVGATSYRIEQQITVCGWGCSTSWSAVKTVGLVTSDTIAGLAANTTYTYRVVPINGTVDMTPTDGVSVTTTLMSLTVLSSGGTNMELAWTNVAEETGYNIERKQGTGGTWQQLATMGYDVSTLTDMGLALNTEYCYRITAHDSNVDLMISDSNGVCAITGGTPENLTASMVNTSQVNLSWSDKTSSETGFIVDRCLGSPCDFSTRDTFFTGPNSQATKSYSDTAACPNSTYTYRVKAVNYGLSNGLGLWTRRTPLTITGFQPNFQTRFVIPFAEGLQPDFDDIRFYDAIAKKELPFWIEKKTDGVSATVWVKTGGNNAVYLYYGNPTATSSSNGAGTFELFDDFGGTTINTSKWAKSSTNLSQNGVITVTAGSAYLASVATFARPFIFEVDHYRTGGATAILGVKDGGYGYATGDFIHGALPVYATGNNRLQVSEDGTSRGDNLKTISSATWQYYKFAALATGAKYYHGDSTDSYSLFYDSSYSSESPLKVGFMNLDQSFEIDNARVRKYAATEPTTTLGAAELLETGYTFDDSTYESNYSNSASAGTPNWTAPGSLTTSIPNELQISLAWADNTSDESGFELERCSGADCDFSTKQTFTVGPNVITYADTNNPVWGTLYRYRVRAVKTGACGWPTGWSPVAEVTMGPPSPQNLNASAANTTTINLTWSNSLLRETGYILGRCQGDTCTDFAEVFSANANATSLQDPGACENTAYSYRIKGINRGFTAGGMGCWTKRQPLTIGNFQPDFQTRLVIPYDSDMQPDFDDIRFYDSTANVDLPYWIESKTDALTATVWLKTGANNTITLYYGNPSATSNSTGTIFEFFQDFLGTTLESMWSATSGASYSVANGTLQINSGAIYYNYLNAPVAPTPQNRVFEMKSQWLNGTASYSGLAIANAMSIQGGNASANALACYMSNADATANLYAWGADGTAASYNIVNGGGGPSGSDPLNTYRIVGFEFKGASQISYFVKGLDYADLRRNTYNGTWTAAPYLSLGYFSGSISGSIDIDDMVVDWVRVRKSATTEPSVTLGAEEAASGACYSLALSYEGSYSTPPKVVTSRVATAPSAPFLTPSATAVALQWTDTNIDESGFRIQRCYGENCSNFVDVATLGANSTTYSDSGITFSTMACYRVAAFKTTTCSWEKPSSPVCVLTNPSVPATVSASADNAFKITLIWADSSPDEDGFEIEAQVWNRSWALIGTVGANVATFTDTRGIDPKRTYSYRVRSFRGSQKSSYGYSNPVTTPAYAPGDTPCP
jgi:uncharacterized delta-60 repeat protein